MRIQRLRVAHFKAIQEREVNFPPVGVTLVQGPNEVGKTSLQEAMDLLFDLPADSGHRRVRAALPLGQDVGAEVEADVECGPYAFTYFKRFGRQAETRLNVRQPRPEQLAGRQAHDRVRAILDETIDADLWRALRIQQGDGLQQAELGQARSLMAALDASTGVTPIGQAEVSLFDRVRKEYGRYYTDTGRDRDELRQTREQTEEARRLVVDIEAKLSGLEKDVERAAWVSRELQGLAGHLASARPAAAQAAGQIQQLERREAEVERLQLLRAAAETNALAAHQAVETREKLILEVENGAAAVQSLQDESDTAQTELQGAESEENRLAQTLQELRNRWEDAERLHELRGGDYEFRRDEIDFQLLRERRDRVADIRKELQRARLTIEQTKIQRAGLRRVERQLLDLERARAARTAGAPTVHLVPEQQMEVLLDAEPTTLHPESPLDCTVPDRLQIQVPDQLTITVRAGTSLEALNQAVHAAQEQLERLYGEYGVADREDAEQQVTEREQAERTLKDASKRESENLRDLTFEQLEAKVAELEERTRRYVVERTEKQPAIGADLETCRILRDAAEENERSTRSAYHDAEQRAESARKHLESVRGRHTDAMAQLATESRHHQAKMRELAEARTATPDEELHANVQGADRTFRKADQNYRTAHEELAASNPDRVRVLAENAKDKVRRLEDQRDQLDRERIGIESRLQALGEQGLAEALQAARSLREQHEHAQTSLERRAAAARHLLDVLQSCRQEARQRREAPLRDRIVDLGRILLGAGFSVELDEELRIARRILDGTALDFEQLSAGTQEQLAVIARLAAAMVVGHDEGVPVVFDDTLGYSDEPRLERMGAILRMAGQRCQVIVLTCYPDRYRHIGDAHEVWLT